MNAWTLAMNLLKADTRPVVITNDLQRQPIGKCKYCGQLLPASLRKLVFCSPECRTAWHNTMRHTTRAGRAAKVKGKK